MSTIFRFSPPITSAYTFQPTLDGNQYTGVVIWNIAGSRYYLAMYQMNGVRVFTLPLIGSVDGVPVESATWKNGFVTITTTEPHDFQTGATFYVDIAGMAPDAYNGHVEVFVTGLNEIQFPLSADPGAATQFGTVTYNINLVAGYFSTSTLVFRDSSQQFEVNP